jgi:hypothetical protein
MVLLSHEESLNWFRARGVVQASGSFGDVATAKAKPLLPDSGVKTSLANRVATHFFCDSECLLFIPESGVWESSEMPFLFEVFRSLRTELKAVREMPGTLVSSSEAEFLKGLLALALYFVWDVVLVDESANVLFYASHDEWYRLQAISDSHRIKVDEFFGA